MPLSPNWCSMRELIGRTAIITGASGGLGSHIAEALADQKMNLVLAGLAGTPLDQLAKKLSGTTSAITVLTDVTDRNSLEHLVRTTMEAFDGLDLLVNNAGVEMISRYHMLALDDIEHNINVNLTGAMLLTRLVLPGMLSRKCGHIINISSLSAKAGPPFAEPYAATKAGLIAFTESLRAEYQHTGVSASVICPGFVTAGIYQRIVDETGLCAPRLLGTSSAHLVAQAVVKAVKEDIPEIIINPGPTRLLTTLAELSPSLAERIMKRIGAVDWFMNVASFREDRRTKQNH
jgi:short-subunit dehydrogenase